MRVYDRPGNSERMLGSLAFCMVLVGCQTAARAPAIGSAWRADAISAEQIQQISENCGPLGRPRIRAEHLSRIGATRLVVYPEFALEHSSLLRIPLWVAEHVTPAEVSGKIPRVDAFHPEPSLPRGERAELADYRFVAYQPGHMAPAGNQTVDAHRKWQTFTLANIIPQNVQQNLEIWDNLEDCVREWARRGPVYMITGPMFWDPKEDSPATADGLVEYFTIGPNHVAVPTHTYKIVARQAADKSWQVIGFVIANANSFPRPWNLGEYVVAIDFIEERTGINFFPMGGGEVELAEAALPSMWPE